MTAMRKNESPARHPRFSVVWYDTPYVTMDTTAATTCVAVMKENRAPAVEPKSNDLKYNQI